MGQCVSIKAVSKSEYLESGAETRKLVPSPDGITNPTCFSTRRTSVDRKTREKMVFCSLTHLITFWQDIPANHADSCILLLCSKHRELLSDRQILVKMQHSASKDKIAKRLRVNCDLLTPLFVSFLQSKCARNQVLWLGECAESVRKSDLSITDVQELLESFMTEKSLMISCPPSPDSISESYHGTPGLEENREEQGEDVAKTRGSEFLRFVRDNLKWQPLESPWYPVLRHLLTVDLRCQLNPQHDDIVARLLDLSFWLYEQNSRQLCAEVLFEVMTGSLRYKSSKTLLRAASRLFGLHLVPVATTADFQRYLGGNSDKVTFLADYDSQAFHFVGDEE